MKTIRLIATQYPKKSQLHAALAQKLGFPAQYGANLDALFDCLTEIAHPTHLVLTGESSLPAGFLRVFRDASQQNPYFFLSESKTQDPIALGCMRIAALTENQLETLVETALAQGISLFDHADIYGAGVCEEKFGALLQQKPHLRQRMQLQSKCGILRGVGYDLSAQHILHSVEQSLRRLHTDYLDTLLLHRPDALMQPEEVAEAFALLRQSGKVKAFGVSNFNASQTAFLQAALGEPLVANQMQLSLVECHLISQGISTNTAFADGIDRHGGVLEYCQQHNMALQCWSPFQYGERKGSFLGNPAYPALNEQLQAIADQYGATKAAVAVAWILRHPAKMQVLAGTTSPLHLTQLCKAQEIALTRPEWYALYRAAGHAQP